MLLSYVEEEKSNERGEDKLETTVGIGFKEVKTT